MIPYEDITIGDGMMYWRNAIIFRYLPEQEVVVPYKLQEVESRSEEEESLFDEAEVTLYRMDTGTFHSIIGRELFASPQYITYRFPIEYVAMGQRLVRVSVESSRSRAYKGTNTNSLTSLPLVSVEDTEAARVDQPEASLLTERVSYSLAGDYSMFRSPEDTTLFATGVCSILTLGTPTCMRQLIDEETAANNARRRVRDFLRSDEVVVVPDFPVALVKSADDRGNATVLRHGRVVGTLRQRGDQLSYYPAEISLDIPQALSLYRSGVERMSNRLFGCAVAWSL